MGSRVALFIVSVGLASCLSGCGTPGVAELTALSAGMGDDLSLVYTADLGGDHEDMAIQVSADMSFTSGALSMSMDSSMLSGDQPLYGASMLYYAEDCGDGVYSSYMYDSVYDSWHAWQDDHAYMSGIWDIDWLGSMWDTSVARDGDAWAVTGCIDTSVLQDAFFADGLLPDVCGGDYVDACVRVGRKDSSIRSVELVLPVDGAGMLMGDGYLVTGASVTVRPGEPVVVPELPDSGIYME